MKSKNQFSQSESRMSQASKNPARVKYSLPKFLNSKMSEEIFRKWLQRRAQAQVKRDRAKGKYCTIGQYQLMIYQAVLRSNGRDAYTGEELDWSKISTYDGKKVKREHLLDMPTIDHAVDLTGREKFEICSWRTNDCKNDLSLSELKQFCRLILKHN